MEAKNGFKKTLACLLVVILLLTGAPLAGLADLDFSVTAQAEAAGKLTYSVENGKATITGHSGAISGSLSIPSTLGGYPVTSIGDSAFDGCTGLTSVAIPNSVTNIGSSAFSFCTGLTSITIPDSVTSIGNYAFFLTEWYDSQPDGVIYAGKVLYEYKGIMPENTCITIKDGTKGIADHAFSNCTSLRSITIPNSVTSISDGAFEYCTGLESVTIGNGVRMICEEAFRDCTGLASITIPDSVTSIGCMAFSNCINFTSVAIPDSVTSINDSAFSDCTGLTRVTIPNSVTSISYNTFGGCTGLTSVTIPDSVTSIDDCAFDGCSGLTSVTIPDSVTSIGEMAFRDCTGLTGVTIPDSVTSIGDYAFLGCIGLISIIIGNSVKSMGDGAFDGCTGLTSLTIPDSVTSINASAFSDCTGLTSLSVDSANKIYHSENNCIIETEKKKLVLGCKNSIIPSDGSVTSIGDFAFVGCTGLTDIIIPSIVTSIGVCTFEGCTALTNIVIPNSVISIGQGAFQWCTGLTRITIPDSVTKIGDYAFYDCTGLTSVTIPESVESIGSKAFGYYFNEDYGYIKIENFTIYGHTGTTAETYANENGFTFIPLEENEVKDEATGISISYTNDVYDNDIQLNVSVVNAGSAFNVLNTEKGNFKKSLFDITTTIDGEKVQPNGTVFVKIPLPDGYNAEKTVVYYVTNDGKLEKIESEVKDGYIIFETTHFSFYAIVDESLTVNPSQNCSCACHKKGIVNFFFKIGLFFQKIFKKNKICKCGAWHY